MAMKIYSADVLCIGREEKKDWAVLVDGNRISRVCCRKELLEEFSGISEVKMDGYLYPAFGDAHVHVAGVAYLLGSIDATAVVDLGSLMELIRAAEDDVYIYNLDFNRIGAENFSVLFDYPEKAIFIQSKDEHSVFLNKVMFEKRGIRLEKVAGGEIVEINGKFTGVLKDNAIRLVRELVNRPVSKEDLKKVERYFLQRGIAYITNMDFGVHDILKKMLSERKMRLRVYQSISKDALGDALKDGIRTGVGDEHFRWGPVKCFLDGSLGSQTAYMYDRSGLLTMSEEEFSDIVRLANENGVQVAVHAIGDLAVHIALKVLKNCGKDRMRNRIEHLQFINERDMELLKDTAFVPSMQPVHAISDAGLVRKQLGEHRYAYAWRSVMESGKILAFGSDAPVEDPSPVLGIYASTTRIPSGERVAFIPEEVIDFDSAVKWYTYGSAYASFWEDEFGGIKEGCFADMVLYNRGLYDVNSRLEAVIVDGEFYSL